MGACSRECDYCPCKGTDVQGTDHSMAQRDIVCIQTPQVRPAPSHLGLPAPRLSSPSRWTPLNRRAWEGLCSNFQPNTDYPQGCCPPCWLQPPPQPSTVTLSSPRLWCHRVTSTLHCRAGWRSKGNLKETKCISPSNKSAPGFFSLCSQERILRDALDQNVAIWGPDALPPQLTCFSSRRAAMFNLSTAGLSMIWK